MKNLPTLSKTERILIITISILSLVLLGSSTVEGNLFRKGYAQEGSEASEVSTEESQEDSVDEESVPSVDEVSTPSVQSIDEVSTPSEPSLDEVSVSSVGEESSPSVDELSTPSVDEVSTPSEPSVDERSVSSGDNLNDITTRGEVIPIGEDLAVIFENERLFFLFPVQIEKTLLLDEEGTVVDVQQTLLSRILSLISF